MPNLTTAQWLWITGAAAVIGFSKMGLGGVLTIIIPLLAVVFGGKESTGMVLPISLLGDIMAISYYRRAADWASIRRLIPWALAGIVVGTVVGWVVSDGTFTMIIGVTVLLCAAVMIVLEVGGDRVKVPRRMWFFALMGTLGGFTTMIGNAAGPVMTVYLLAMSMNKENFVGTYAWFFLIVNAIKMPLQLLLWRSIGGPELLMALAMIPVIALGAVLGAYVVKRIPERPFRYTVISLTVVAGLRIFL
ncbi:MAG: sulfite exporter TauE/SafE family protein [Oscillospiraceae bacterium]|jgi:uncharacterized membrane protein YfcA|nr:sulfite exporter TauE/SafE family protein [Oscillospiraceae bacterium]